MTQTFYRAFEDKYRGSRELIISRLSVYLPFVKLLKGCYTSARAIDLGCGRGEWLQVLASVGIESFGVDLDEGMLAACRERGFDVTAGDAINFLKELPDESAVIVSGFHLAEHIDFSRLHELVSEARRVLKPGGLLILETPNPENITVGASDFYIDPTHVRPIPPALLAYLPEYYGYARVKILRLQEAVHLRRKLEPTLVDVLMGVSPDYSVVAQKQAEADMLEKFDGVFAQHYGVSLMELASAYDHQMEELIMNAQAAAERAELAIQQIEMRIVQMDATVRSAQSEVRLVEDHLGEILTSRSWRITAPIRRCGAIIQRLRGVGAKGLAKVLKQDRE